jgi:DNA-binding beta-propeller fold protein YncE
MSRFCATLLGFSILCAWLRPSAAANFAPFAAISASPQEVLAGQAILFSSAGSVDPDSQPEPLSFQWTFGDGETSSDANPRHSFSRAGAYTVSLEVSDGLDQSIASLTVVVLDPPTAIPPAKSSPICFNGDQTELWNVNQDSGTVTVFSITGGSLTNILELPTGKSPRTVAFAGGRVFVACQDDGELWIFTATSHTLERKIRVGHLPFAVCVAPVTGKIVISSQGDGTVHIFDNALRLERIIPVSPTPRAVAITADGTRAYVTDFITTGATGVVTEIDLSSNTRSKEIKLVEDPGPDTPSSSKGLPNLLSALSIEPAGRALWVGGYKSNSGRGAFRTGESLTPLNTVRGFFGRVNTATGAEEPARRIDPNNADSVSSIAFSPNGRLAFVTHQGAETVSVYDVITSEQTEPGDGNSVPFLSRVDVGAAPAGVLVSESGRFLYVANYQGRSVTAVDITDPSLPQVVQTIASTAEPLSPSIANGKRHFYSSKAPVHSKDNYISCASCHADGGGHDGRTWDFTHKGEGLRNTMDLRGRSGTADGPLHWSGNFDEVQDFEIDIVNAFGGTGLAADGNPPNPALGLKNSGRSVNLDDLAAYVTSLSNAPPSPFRLPDRTLSPAARRGKALFLRSDLACTQCHIPPAFTDSFLTPDVANFIFHDVGTLQPSSGQRLGSPLSGIDTPSLLGLWASAPYLHDGSAATLSDLFTSRNADDTHGRTSSLSSDEVDDLISYLSSLDSPSAPDLPADQDNDLISDSWERLYQLDPLNGSDSNADPDADSMSNIAEFLAGTDPNDSSSALRLYTRRSTPLENEIWFHSVRGILYLVESRPDLSGRTWKTVEQIQGDGTSKALVVARTEAQQFYRLSVVPLP